MNEILPILTDAEKHVALNRYEMKLANQLMNGEINKEQYKRRMILVKRIMEARHILGRKV